MHGNRYGRGWMEGRGYGRDSSSRRGPVRGHGPARRRGYDAEMRGPYDRGWTQDVAYGRAPGLPNGPGMFTPFGWDPMLRWSGWDPMLGFVPYQDTPREGSYRLAGDDRRYGHDFYRENAAYAYDGEFRRGPEPDPRPPRRGYDAGYAHPPRRGPRR